MSGDDELNFYETRLTDCLDRDDGEVQRVDEGEFEQQGKDKRPKRNVADQNDHDDHQGALFAGEPAS